MVARQGVEYAKKDGAQFARDRISPDAEDFVDADQIAERLAWTPKQRLDYLVDILDFETRARLAQRIS
ncbi:MAG: hypothetical protein H6Q91_3392 [Deltaproteobacteria bacterium]|nr:hypothetical protein [Deltaproteobacteria bacterium]